VATNPRWTGYIATPASDGVASFDRVQASYTVPTADCAATPNTFAYQWVGLDGYSDSTIEQDGVGVICSGTTPDYFSWYEMYPSGLQEQFAVTPGDTITSSVVYSPATQDYTLALTDTTSDQSFSLAEACPSGSTCDNSSAETNSEGYYSDGTFTGTTDFGTETFSDIRLGGTTAAGKQKTGALKNSGWGLLKAQALGQSGKADAKAGAITQAGTPSRSSFTVTWLRAN
jgi:hypothetical protein